MAGPDLVESLRIHIVDGHETDDYLAVPVSEPAIVSHFDPGSGVLSLSGRAPLAAYQRMVESVEFAGQTQGQGHRSFLVLAAPMVYFPESGNVYEYVGVGENISWTEANEAAGQSHLGPFPGHLVTISSEAENELVRSSIKANTWIGGSDLGVEGEFRWDEYSDKPTQFWTGGSRGVSTGASFTKWAAGEPNDLFGSEDYVHMYAGSGEWNDFVNYAHGTDNNGYFSDGTYDQAEHVTGYTIEYPIEELDRIAVPLDFETRISPPVPADPGQGQTDSLVSVSVVNGKAQPAAHCDVELSVDYVTSLIGREIAQLYLVTFNRAPDLEGFSYWVDKLLGGANLDELRWAFAYSEEFTVKYMDMDDADFVETMYTSVLCRVPDPEGQSYWLGLLDAGKTRHAVYFYISKSSEFQLSPRVPVNAST